MVKHLSFIKQSKEERQIDVFVYNTIVDVWNEKKIESYPRKKLSEIKEGLHKKGFSVVRK